jgi:nitrous oxidase accessory protein NosD
MKRHGMMGFLLALLAFLTALMVVSSADIMVAGGLQTLRAAIDQATDGDRLRILPGIHNGTGFCGVIVEKSISIIGDQGAILDCEGRDRMLDVRVPVTIEGLTFSNGLSMGEWHGAASRSIGLIALTLLPYACKFDYAKPFVL